MDGGILLTERVLAESGPALREAAGELPLVVLGAGGVAGDPAGVSVAYFSGELYPAGTREFIVTLAKARELRWLHSFSAGVDHPWFGQLLARGIRVTHSSGASAVPIAHTVMLYLLALSRDLRSWEEARSRRAWEPHDFADLQGQRLGILGMGPIGRSVAGLGMAFGMETVGMTRRPRGDEPCETWPLSRLEALLARTDWLVLALPLTDETRGILSAARLACLPPGARLVNVGRGDLVDEAALVAALRSGRLAGAGLDVFATEPLPPESPLWEMRHVIVTPHAAGSTPANHGRATRIFIENLLRWRRGEALRNEVMAR